MVHRKFQSAGQMHLFGEQELTNDITPEGVSVDIASRRVNLLGVLASYGTYRRLEGLCLVADPATNHPTRGQIENRYGAGTDKVLDNSFDKAKDSFNQSKIEFAVAAGHYALIQAGYPQAEVKNMTRELFNDFIAKFYTDLDAAKNRAKIRRSFKKK